MKILDGVAEIWPFGWVDGAWMGTSRFGWGGGFLGFGWVDGQAVFSLVDGWMVPIFSSKPTKLKFEGRNSQVR